MEVVSAIGLTKRFGDLTAVSDLSFELEAGSVTGFLGPNGAGKTTTLRMLLGLARPTRGQALVFGRPFAELEQPAARVGAVLEASDLHPGRTGHDHLRVLARAAAVPESRVDEVLALVDLTGAAERRAGGYSLGMRQRLALAAALLGDPELLVLDEPANGLDPEGVRWLRDFLRGVRHAGRHRPRLEPPPGRGRPDRGPGRDHRPRPARGRVDPRGARHRAVVAGGRLPRAHLGASFVIAQLRSELLKQRTTRTVGLLLLAATGLTLLGVVVEGISSTLAELAQEDQQLTLLGAGSSGAVLFATFAGLLAVTSEFRYGTIRPTLLVQPRRRVVLAAKLAAAGITGVLFAVACLALSLGAGLAILAARDIDVAPTGADLAAIAGGTVVAAALSALLGVAIGTLVRNQVGAVVAVVAYAFLVDATLFAAAPGVGRYLPGKAGDALAGQPVEDLLAPGVGAAVLAAWTLAVVVAATVRTDRSDV